jgi:signal transduction histidine kinase
MLVAILASIVAGYLRTPAPRRPQVRVLAVTLGIAAGASLILTSVPIAVLGHPLAPRSAVAILAIPVILALALAVIRDRLFQVDLLATSRRRIIAAREEERLRLRRDLHDGLGPTLAALGLKVDRARAEAAANPEAVGPLLDEIRADLRGALSQIRTLSRELRPPGLDALGLVDTLRQQLATVAGPDVPVVEIDATDLGPLPPAIEVAAYRIVVEAVTNTVRHAGARLCRVSLTRDGPSLVIRVVDDGRGIEPGPVGVGTRAMYERAAEVGGELLVGASPDGGTVVSVSLPLGPAGRAGASPAAANALGSGPSLPPDTFESVTQP